MNENVNQRPNAGLRMSSVLLLTMDMLEGVNYLKPWINKIPCIAGNHPKLVVKCRGRKKAVDRWKIAAPPRVSGPIGRQWQDL